MPADATFFPATAATRRSIRSGFASASLTGLFLFTAVVVGAVATVKPAYAIALIVALAVVVLVVSHIQALPPLLVVTMYAEGVSFGGVHIGRLVGLFAAAALVYYVLTRRRADLEANLLLLVGGAYGLWILASIYWASDDHWVYLTLFRWVLAFAYMLAFAILIRSPDDLRPVMVAFVLAAVVFGVVGLIAYLQGGGQRGTGLQGDPNIFAAYQVLAIPPALVLAGLERRAHLRVAYYAAVAFIILSVGASFSRGGLLALGAVAVLTVILPWRLLFNGRGAKLAYVLFLAFGGWLIAVLGSTQYLTRIQSILHGSDRGTGRLDIWSAGIRGYSHHPWSGLGAGGFQSQSLTLIQNTPGVAPSSLIDTAARPIHNAYLEPLVDLGPVGLALYSAILVVTLWYLITAARTFGRTKDLVAQRLTVCVAISFLSLLVASIFLSIGLGKAVWMYVGIALAMRRMARDAEAEEPSAPMQAADAGSPRTGRIAVRSA
jgi:O-antigen ligase